MDFISNYHTHTLFCGHGEGHPIDYAKEAINKGLKNLGFTEHAELPGTDFTFTIKGHMEEYYNEITEAKEKFKDKLNIYCGLEVDYYPEYKEYYKNLHEKFDYLTLSVHFLRYNTKDKLGSWNGYTDYNLARGYVEFIIDGMKTGLFKYINHPDNFICIWDDEIIRLSKKLINASILYDVPLELNGNQFARMKINTIGSPREMFWRLAGEMKCKVIINTDAHLIKDLVKFNVPEMLDFAKKHNLNVIKELEI